MDTIDPGLLERLRTVDTPTVCNAIEVAEGRRGFDAFTRGTLVASHPTAPSVVGFARTAVIRGSRPSTDPVDEVRARRLQYFHTMTTGPNPGVAVVEDLDAPNPVGAWWGEVNAAIHRGLGLAGALTNGLVRDLGDLPEGFPILAGAVGVSHGFVHVERLGGPVHVFGLTINEGDLVHADRHGALVIPPHVYGSLNAAIDTLLSSEKLVLDPAYQPGFDLETLLEAWKAFEKART